VIPPEARGTAAGFMNAIGWLAGGGGAAREWAHPGA